MLQLANCTCFNTRVWNTCVTGQKYWAKDVIFLVTEHEQLGMQAWLEAYHRTTCGRPGVLDHGDMMGRGGAIQAAINLELHAEKIGHVDVKVEGLNGQLPNLDLVNLVHRMCSKEGVRHTFKNKDNVNYRSPVKEWVYQLKTLMAMVTAQATGVPNGNHGLFHRRYAMASKCFGGCEDPGLYCDTSPCVELEPDQRTRLAAWLCGRT
ncbi:hypothetical protein PR048_030860 [Dryococelus australis]|uniref:Uncharacterized protein n=1 Tax=Dryococelus australis TaxID=614101 RepID=A0ABQ9GA29_9NEOP|nr:hypothetical protein PR048_030860 [Dryococelus australis]